MSGRAAHHSGPKEEASDIRTLARARHTPDHAAEEWPVPLPIPPQISIALQAALKVVVADEQTLDDPRDLTEQTTAQTAFSNTPRSGRAGFLYQTGGVNS
jgi:hypothetical protein